MYIHKTETELANKIRMMSAVETVQYLMEEGLELKPDMQEYSVSLTFDIEAESPEDAVKEAISVIEWRDSTLWDFEYEVTELGPPHRILQIPAYTIAKEKD